MLVDDYFFNLFGNACFLLVGTRGLLLQLSIFSDWPPIVSAVFVLGCPSLLIIVLQISEESASEVEELLAPYFLRFLVKSPSF